MKFEMKFIIAYKKNKNKNKNLIYQKNYLLVNNIQELLNNLENIA